MGWETDLFALFDDLEQQAATLQASDRLADHLDRSRAEYQQVSLAGRLMASVGAHIAVVVVGIEGPLSGVLERVSDGWLLLASGEHDWIVPTAAVGVIEGASVRAVPEPAWSPLTRIDLGSALRRVAEVGERCVLHLRDGSRHEGVLRRVGADFCELVEGEHRRTLLVAFDALAAAQSRS